jgi:hypothetical protein
MIGSILALPADKWQTNEDAAIGYENVASKAMKGV